MLSCCWSLLFIEPRGLLNHMCYSGLAAGCERLSDVVCLLEHSDNWGSLL